jgi:hypothetical protein
MQNKPIPTIFRRIAFLIVLLALSAAGAPLSAQDDDLLYTLIYMDLSARRFGKPAVTFARLNPLETFDKSPDFGRRYFRAKVNVMLLLGYDDFFMQPQPSLMRELLELQGGTAYLDEVAAIDRIFGHDSDFAYSGLDFSFPIAIFGGDPELYLYLPAEIPEWLFWQGKHFIMKETFTAADRYRRLIIAREQITPRAEAFVNADVREWIVDGGVFVWFGESLPQNLLELLPDTVPAEAVTYEVGEGYVVWAPTMEGHEDVLYNAIDLAGLPAPDYYLRTVRSFGPQWWSLTRRDGASLEHPLTVTYFYKTDKTEGGSLGMITDRAMVIGGAMKGRTFEAQITRWARNWDWSDAAAPPEEARIQLSLPAPAESVTLDGEPVDFPAGRDRFDVVVTLTGEHRLAVTLEDG